MIPASLEALVTAKQKAALDFALTNIGVCEDPPGSNRGPEIDEWTTEFGSPLGSYWCAISVGKARKMGGLWIPDRDVASCDEWVYQAFRDALVISEPVPAAAVVYTNGKRLLTGRYAGQLDAVHIGTVLRAKPVAQSIEGNTTLGKYDRNGYTQALKEIDHVRVLCYIAPGDA
jgi:hypothetical protein